MYCNLDVKLIFFIESITAVKSVDATEEPEHQVVHVVMGTAQLENDSMGLVKEKNVPQKKVPTVYMQLLYM